MAIDSDSQIPFFDSETITGLARVKSRNDYVEFINRERPHGIM